jgi:hypothetical protein
MTSNDFYIGWMPAAPASLAKFARRVVLALGIMELLAALAFGLGQKKFGTGNFEYGRLTEVKGIYFNRPVPCIKAIAGKDIFGRLTYITIPLVGYGKFGAEGIMGAIEKERGMALDQREITLKGTLLYNDGKLLMQVDGNDSVLIRAGSLAAGEYLPAREDLGAMDLTGEIIDPKCYFGVMKPGEGKPHKDCAVRCILGGIPPMLKVTNDKGEQNYYLLLGSDGTRINTAAKDLVSEPVTLHAQAVKVDDWVLLYVNPAHGIERYSYLREKFGPSIQTCAASCKN